MQAWLAFAKSECFLVLSSSSQLRVLLASLCKGMPCGNPWLSVSCFGSGTCAAVWCVCSLRRRFSWVLGSLMGVCVRCFGASL